MHGAAIASDNRRAAREQGCGLQQGQPASSDRGRAAGKGGDPLCRRDIFGPADYHCDTALYFGHCIADGGKAFGMPGPAARVRTRVDSDYAVVLPDACCLKPARCRLVVLLC